MSTRPFETVAQAHRIAKRVLPKPVYRSLIAGTEKGLTLRDNLRAFDELWFRPRILDRPGVRNQRTRVMGQELPFPVIISSVGVQAVHPEGELPVARAAAAAGTAMALSSFASSSIEDVVAANPKTFFQLYWVGSRDYIQARIERAKRAGAKGVVLTLDWSFAMRRDWGSPTIPERLTLGTVVRYAPMALANPLWTARFLSHGRLPDLTVPNLADPGKPPPTFLDAYAIWAKTPLPTWDDIAWVRTVWDGPLMIKGVMEPDEARRAVDIGATAISVSNHGGNNVDGIPASLRALPAVVDAVGGKIEILMDGGVRRGSDVVKALALGADSVLIGRAYLWGVAAAGEAGVGTVLDILREGIDESLLALGRGSVHELTSSDFVIPTDFTAPPRSRVGVPSPPVSRVEAS